MSKSMKDTKPFNKLYKLFNKESGKVEVTTFDLSELVAKVSNRWALEHIPNSNTYTLKLEPQVVTIRGKVITYAPPLKYVILDEFGVVEEKIIQDVRRTLRKKRRSYADYYKKYDAMMLRIKPVKGSAKKIKSSCTEIGGCFYRSPLTLGEKRFNIAHIEEYGEEFVRGRRRNLPSNWDDLRVSMYDTRPSWKHHSKRRKQWIAK